LFEPYARLVKAISHIEGGALAPVPQAFRESKNVPPSIKSLIFMIYTGDAPPRLPSWCVWYLCAATPPDRAAVLSKDGYRKIAATLIKLIGTAAGTPNLLQCWLGRDIEQRTSCATIA
jgi:hypothetical protein